jgi:hypothetical protein
MPVTNLLLPEGLVGPGAVIYPVQPSPLGGVIYVNSVTGKDDRRRLNFPGAASTTTQGSLQGPYGDPAKPLKSVFGPAGALAACLAGRGDLIVCLPGHVEVLPAGDILIPGQVSILGCGYGSGRPTFQYSTNANSRLRSNGVGIRFHNLIFDLTQIAAVVSGFLLAHSGVQFVSCRLIQASAGNQAANGITLNTGADDFQFVNSEIDAIAAAGAVTAISNPAAQAVNRPYIYNSWIHGDFSTAPLSILTTTTKEILVEFSTFKQVNAAKTVWNLAAGNAITGMFSYNDLWSASAGAHGDFIAGGTGTQLGFLQNFAYIAKAGPSSGILIPDVGTIP